ncbi:LysM peptidoglycan-binding domain-containing protein [Nitrincola sp. MINF-07-Sa-05]|uniref:LysM peptidoglycan-binding domain-containing protein n=1 Tax=Nitrincola salilacus TaxID=3400273 RepID=UPI00391801A4
MKHLLCGLLVAGLLSVSVVTADVRQDQVKLRDGHPTEYVVVPGDTLWDISARFLNSPWLWPEVWGVNPQIDNPHLIYPGDVVYLTWVDGRPRLGLRSGGSDGVKKLSPQVRVQPLERAVPAIPLRDIMSFLNDNRVLEYDALETAPYVVGAENKRIISGAGDRIYARGELLAPDRLQGIYRPVREYVHPGTGEFLGYELFKVADTAVASQQDDIVTLELRRTREEVRSEYRVLPGGESRIQSMFYPKPAPYTEDGLVIDILKDGVDKIGQYDPVVLSVGRRDRVEPGDVFAIYSQGETLRDPVTGESIQLPAEEAGVLMVFRSFDRVSYGLIMRATNVISIGDEIRTP